MTQCNDIYYVDYFNVYPSDACAIAGSEEEGVVVTGGHSDLAPHYRDNVTRYGKFGWLEDLPSLIQGRAKHGCASYIQTEGDRVSKCLN